uniref:Glutathione S-transferase epsilon 3 n=1 Tax=Heortia vitessoides TaxID=1557813 RepID=A0A3G1RJ71_9NEOP|nr:glutathione S-transferase epsilon 3 [Heortia vitessoides]
MVLTLYKLDASPPVRAVYMTLDVLGITDVEMVDVNLFTKDHLKDDYLQMNPQHTIPTLKDDDFVIWDSHAICTYLVNKYADSDALYPKDLKQRAIVDQRLHFDSGILFPALRGNVEPVAFRGAKSYTPENLEKVRSAYNFSEKFLTSEWLAGNEFTLADICCLSSISTLNIILPIDEEVYPNLSAWLKRCEAKDFYKKWNQPGLEQLTQLIKTKCE